MMTAVLTSTKSQGVHFVVRLLCKKCHNYENKYCTYCGACVNVKQLFDDTY